MEGCRYKSEGVGVWVDVGGEFVKIKILCEGVGVKTLLFSVEVRCRQV